MPSLANAKKARCAGVVSEQTLPSP